MVSVERDVEGLVLLLSSLLLSCYVIETSIGKQRYIHVKIGRKRERREREGREKKMEGGGEREKDGGREGEGGRPENEATGMLN